MKDGIWPDDSARFDDVFEQAANRDTGGPIEDPCGCTHWGGPRGDALIGVVYLLPRLGLWSTDLLERADPEEYRRLQQQLDRRAVDGCPWIVLGDCALDADDEAALLKGFGLTLAKAQRLFTDIPDQRDASDPEAHLKHRSGASVIATARWHRRGQDSAGEE